jgi:hypothetical protein
MKNLIFTKRAARKMLRISQSTMLTIEITAICLAVVGFTSILLFGIIALLVAMVHVVIGIF